MPMGSQLARQHVESHAFVNEIRSIPSPLRGGVWLLSPQTVLPREGPTPFSELCRAIRAGSWPW
jgi:hypothetical protein